MASDPSLEVYFQHCLKLLMQPYTGAKRGSRSDLHSFELSRECVEMAMPNFF